MIQFEQWEGFEGRIWKEEVNVRDFIQKNYTPYDGDESFLAGPTEATDKLWGALQQLQKAERAKGGVLDMETEVVSSLPSYGPGYIDESLKDLEQIVGLQTDKPLKRAFMPYGGIKMAEQACTTYGYQPSAELHKIFTDYTRTHNQAVFDAYTPEMKKARHTHIITGLPDTYGRGRIVGDYRRVALYGIDALIQFKQEDLANCGDGTMTDDVIRLREEIARQISALKGMKKMAEAYGYEPVDNYNSGDERFFNASDEELERYSKGIARQDRKRRNVGLKILVAFFVLLLLAAGAGVFLYTQGYGYPTQESVVKGLFADTENASSYFVSSMSSDKVDDAMRGVVSDSDVAIDGMDKSMSNSTVYVTASTPEGGEVSYTVSMVRDMLGWKVSGVQMTFASQQS